MANVSDSNLSNLRIYVACLAAYNKGILHGAWIEANQDADQIRDEIAAMLARSSTAWRGWPPLSQNTAHSALACWSSSAAT